jgi:hypothetical protein
LKKSMDALNSMDTGISGEVDTASIMRKMGFLEQNLNEKADKTEVVEARAYSDEKIAEAMAQTEKTFDSVRNEICNFREDYSLFRSKDFAGLEARVTALEKRRSGANSDGEGSHAPDYVSPANGGKIDDSVIAQINNRLTNVEANFNDLRDQFAKWIKQI